MANKLFLIYATLALCFLLINASSYDTIVEFDEDDETNPSDPSGQQKCQKEFQKEKHLRACQGWMRRKARTSGATLDDDEFEDPQQLLIKCCNELRQEDTDCVCPTLRQAAKAVDLHLRGEHKPYKPRKIYRTVKVLPNMCNMPKVGICTLRASPYY